MTEGTPSAAGPFPSVTGPLETSSAPALNTQSTLAPAAPTQPTDKCKNWVEPHHRPVYGCGGFTPALTPQQLRAGTRRGNHGYCVECRPDRHRRVFPNLPNAPQQQAQRGGTNPTANGLLPFGAVAHPITYYSYSVTKDGGDVEHWIYDAMVAWLSLDNTVRGGIGLERGGRRHQLHVQAFSSHHCPSGQVGVDMFKVALKEHLGMERVMNGHKIIVKEMGSTQTPVWMLGYISKDVGNAWSRVHIKGFTEGEFREGRALHSISHSDYELNKSTIKRQSFMNQATSFKNSHLPGVNGMNIAHIIRFMLLSKSFVPGYGWYCLSNGHAFDFERCDLILSWMEQDYASSAVTLNDVMFFFFGFSNARGTGSRLQCQINLLRGNVRYDDMSWEEVKLLANYDARGRLNFDAGNLYSECTEVINNGRLQFDRLTIEEANVQIAQPDDSDNDFEGLDPRYLSDGESSDYDDIVPMFTFDVSTNVVSRDNTIA